MKKNILYDFDQKIRKKHNNILGIDEVGRGCVAGPLVVAGVILNTSFFDPRIKDSKKIKSIKLRDELAKLIINNSVKYKFFIFDNKQVDQLNPKECSKIGMKKIAESLKNHFDIVITDYEKINSYQLQQINLTKGDNKSFSVACASILAKHIRDIEILKLDQIYPEYDLKTNQGYLTKKHNQLIQKYGIKKEIHRLTYNPIKNYIKKFIYNENQYDKN